MLKEVDFSRGVRGSHYGRVRIVGAVESHVTSQSTTIDTRPAIDLSLSNKLKKSKSPKKSAK
jgi:hypothetical protein